VRDYRFHHRFLVGAEGVNGEHQSGSDQKRE